MHRGLALSLAFCLVATGCVTTQQGDREGGAADENGSDRGEGPGIVVSDGHERQRLPSGATVERPEPPGSAGSTGSQGSSCEWLLAWEDRALFEPVNRIASAGWPMEAFQDQVPSLDVIAVDAAPAHGVPVTLDLDAGPAPSQHLVAIGRAETLTWEADNGSRTEQGWMRLTRIEHGPSTGAWLGAHLPPDLPEDLYQETVRRFLENVSTADAAVVEEQVAMMTPERVDPGAGRPSMNVWTEGPWRLGTLVEGLARTHEPGDPQHPLWPVGRDALRGGAWPPDERAPDPLQLTLGDWTLGLAVPAARLDLSANGTAGHGNAYLDLQVDHMGHAWASLDTDAPVDRTQAHDRLTQVLRDLGDQVPDAAGWTHGDDACL